MRLSTIIGAGYFSLGKKRVSSFSYGASLHFWVCRENVGSLRKNPFSYAFRLWRNGEKPIILAIFSYAYPSINSINVVQLSDFSLLVKCFSSILYENEWLYYFYRIVTVC